MSQKIYSEFAQHCGVCYYHFNKIFNVGGVCMQNIIEIYDNYHNLGIKNRTITVGDEIKLVKEYVNYRKESFIPASDRKLAIFLEIQVANAYPDIVFVEYNPENYFDWNEFRNQIGIQEMKILYHIYTTRGLDFNDLVTQLGITWKEAGSCIEKLYDSKLIKRENKQWMLVDQKKITTQKIEAVEAKLNQWEQVLQQSIINKNFASESYALSIAKSKPQKEILNKFKKFGIGVCIKEGDNFNVIKEAKRNSMPVSFNSILFNEWIGRILNSGREITNVFG